MAELEGEVVERARAHPQQLLPRPLEAEDRQRLPRDVREGSPPLPFSQS